MCKKIMLTICSLVLLLLIGCGSEEYIFQNSVNEIESIEIVSAESSLEFSVTKKLSESEMNDFLEEFQTICFEKYYFGDPMVINGNAVKITYQSGDYEMICYYWSEYVKDDDVYYIRKYCDEVLFQELINKFLE